MSKYMRNKMFDKFLAPPPKDPNYEKSAAKIKFDDFKEVYKEEYDFIEQLCKKWQNGQAITTEDKMRYYKCKSDIYSGKTFHSGKGFKESKRLFRKSCIAELFINKIQICSPKAVWKHQDYNICL